jgi:hypothetical protein
MEAAISGIVAGLGGLASVFWISRWVDAIRYRKTIVWLADEPAEPPEGGWPTLAVIFAARNEAGMVECAVRSMLAQDYPSFELIAVDDRSTDATGVILDSIAAEDARLRVVHVRELPSGWLGKNHALQGGAASTSSDWLLFTDADVILAPGTLRRGVALAARAGLDHLAAIPDTITESEWERIFLATFWLMFIVHAPPWKVSDPRSKAAAGIGAFTLVRAEAFRAVGGFRHLALSVDDDIRLGQALKYAGYRTRIVMGRRAFAVRWQVGLRGMVRGLEKNFFAGIDFQLATVLLSVPAMFVVGLGPHLGLFFGPWWTRAICAAGLGSIALLLKRERGQSGIAWYHALTLPLGAAACAFALVRSTWLTLRRRGVRWRDHLYPLDELRAHVRRRNAWAREVWRSTR